MNAAWAAVIIAAVTVVANIFGVARSGKVQREIARGERVGDRQIETYLDLLRWMKGFEDLSDVSSFLEVVEAMKLPDDLEIRSLAFASDMVRLRADEFKTAWFAMYRRMQKFSNEEKAALLRHVTGVIGAWVAGRKAPPLEARAGQAELGAMLRAREAVSDAIRRELLGEIAARGKPISWHGALGGADPR